MKEEIDILNGTPSKRLFLSIIADYDVNRSLCELIDNALDLWNNDGGKKQLEIAIELNQDQQIMKVTDNAGGVKEENLSALISPGQTLNDPNEEVIGLFGVGTKRAIIALSQDITLTTRHKIGNTFQVEVNDDWLKKDDDWTLPYYKVDNISPGTTIIELQKLRNRIENDIVDKLIIHLSYTYAKFLTNKNVRILVNGTQINPILFDNWAYPPSYLPQKFTGKLLVGDKEVEVEILAGLSNESSPASGEYGVYIYCNDRLIGKALKSYEVGFGKGLAGLPHPSIALAKIIVSLKGPARIMPWNSSKSDINPNSPVFIGIRKYLFEVVKEYTSLSRRLQGHWEDEVFQYYNGKIETRQIKDFTKVKAKYLPPLPILKPRYIHSIKAANSKIAGQKPWTTGLYESIIAVDTISNQKLEQRNRICLILLDSTLEIAFKEFLVNESKGHYNDTTLIKLFGNRADVQKEIQTYKKFSKKAWKQVTYYYNMRCKLIHEKATVQISDKDIEIYRGLVESIIKKLFGKLTF